MPSVPCSLYTLAFAHCSLQGVLKEYIILQQRSESYGTVYGFYAGRHVRET